MHILVILSFLATLMVNGLANALPINGQTTGEISNRFDVLFTPAAYVFAIWGLIYLGLAVFCVVQALPGQRENPRLKRARLWVALSGPANLAWLVSWHYEQFVLSMAAMLALLLLLILTYRALRIGREPVSPGERWSLQVPIGVYLGWISVATIANFSVVLEVVGWGGAGLSPLTWTLVMMAVALALAAGVVWRHGDAAFPLVLVWAFVGIAVRHTGAPTLATGAWVAAAIAGGVAVIAFARRRSAPALAA